VLTMLLNFQVCQKTFEVIYDIAHNRKLSIVNEIKNGNILKAARKKKVQQLQNTKSASLKTWLGLFFENTCDIMPMCDNMNGSTHRHLPSTYNKTKILEKYNTEMETRKQNGNSCYRHNDRMMSRPAIPSS